MNDFSPELTSVHEILTFRLYISIKFNKPVKDNDSTSFGSFTFDFNGLPVRFDFEDVSGGRSKEDNSIVNFEYKDPDHNTFPESKVLTKEMLKYVTGIIEIFSDIEEGNFDKNDGNGDNYLHPVEVVESSFVVINGSVNEETLEEIPIPILKGWKFQN